MKAHVYGEPHRGLVKGAGKLSKRWPGLKWSLQATVYVVALLVFPLAWVLVKIGEVGHAIGGWCGWDTREWT